MAFDYSCLDAFEQNFVPQQTGFRPGLDALPNGAYDMEITDARCDYIKSDAVLRLGVRPIGGATVERLYWLTTQDNLNGLGADLCVLGFDADKWKARGHKLSMMLPPVLAKLPGIRFKATKTSRAGTGAYTGKVYHDLCVVTRLATGNQMPASSPELPAGNSQVPDAARATAGGDIPF